VQASEVFGVIASAGVPYVSRRRPSGMLTGNRDKERAFVAQS
jgi:hypothetical protein